jgi:uncharacterized protein involved in exopolysaccharide biosynthesis
MSETGSPQGNEALEKEDKGVSLQDILPPIWAERKRIVLISVGVAILTLIINFLLPNYYKATATLLPETEKSKLSALGQFADIAQIAGVSIPGSEIARLYPSILNSETILRSVIGKTYETKRFSSPVNLIQYFELDEDTPEKNMDKALKRLRKLMTTSYENRTGIVNLTLEMREPQLAADVLNAVVSELDNFMRSKRISNASEQRKWIEVRMKEVGQDLSNSEEALKEFREKNRQVSSSPQLLLEQERLARAVQINSTVFIELKRQYELAKIEEIKNIPIVNVLDPARAPITKERPKRATNTALMLLLSIVGSGGYFFVQQKYSTQISNFLRNVRSRSPA